MGLVFRRVSPTTLSIYDPNGRITVRPLSGRTITRPQQTHSTYPGGGVHGHITWRRSPTGLYDSAGVASCLLSGHPRLTAQSKPGSPWEKVVPNRPQPHK
ncbi:hypothetical protein OPQ81_001129 [Rhizoctonia solani]|nr:hypothetical protein OPQ81_001129 [Rhizoctonia solani]